MVFYLLLKASAFFNKLVLFKLDDLELRGVSLVVFQLELQFIYVGSHLIDALLNFLALLFEILHRCCLIIGLHHLLRPDISRY